MSCPYTHICIQLQLQPQFRNLNLDFLLLFNLWRLYLYLYLFRLLLYLHLHLRHHLYLYLQLFFAENSGLSPTEENDDGSLRFSSLYSSLQQSRQLCQSVYAALLSEGSENN